MTSQERSGARRRRPAADGAELDRRTQILNAAIEYFGTMGYYGTSLQKIATKVGLTKAGVLHYVGSKEGLLELVLSDIYDRETNELLEECAAQQSPSIPEMFRRNVEINIRRPKLVHMFSTLSAEALDPNHPAHEYFARREQEGVDQARKVAWSVPDGVDPTDVLLAGFSMMDGVQLRWLRRPGQDLAEMWAHCENVLFPLPLWQDHR
ncbi:TetR/AcrR family transcriptional regulator [Bifidobacterium sp. 82T24]|nr:TetR/AcrR family transcriptional regulator [Bifidobacterium pluvialisilvae]